MNRHGSYRTGLDARNLLVIVVGLALLAIAWDYAAVLLVVAVVAIAVNIARFVLARNRSKR